jgi:hypothetical protein
MEVFKLQRPLAANVGTETQPFLMYNEDRSQQAFVPKEVVPEALRLATMTTGKCYVQAEVVGDKVQWGDLARARDW